MEKLSSADLVSLIQSVFPRHPDDKFLGILVDIPQHSHQDGRQWQERRKLAFEWFCALRKNLNAVPLEGVRLIAYPDVGSNNADLPEQAVLIKDHLPEAAGGLDQCGEKVLFEDVFKETQLFLAPTEFSTTAPLKNAARRFGFRAATMPGFSSEMVPALKIDYGQVSRRVSLLKEKLDRAEWADVRFLVDSLRGEFKVLFDLRFRTAHASTGRFPDQRTAGNLPSGEAYIVPYEGERNEWSRTEGVLPVQTGDDLVLFSIVENRAVHADGEGESARLEREHLRKEPAYGNMAELGFGVLEDFGLQPIGEILLDEKLGFHVAFGRSEHFGGAVGPKDFSSPQEVIHLDRIYIPATQPRISVKSIVFGYPENQKEQVLANGKYLIFES
ncbi:MAG: hypothetical protein WCC06_07815 [Candidatus Aminicenantales bacterium]